MRRLSLGKIPIETLNSTVLRYTGARSTRVATPAKPGVDFAALDTGHGYVIVSTDPVTGIAQGIGRYALKISANDVATSGNAPQFAESVILLPEGSSQSELRRIARDIHEAAKEGGIAIVGGHTEVTPGIRHAIVVVTAFSLAERFVSSSGARDGDSILMTKTAGIEGTSELARECRFPKGTVSASALQGARRLIDRIDVTREAVAAFRTGSVHAMHDCTEGGVLGAVFEMSLSSGLGFAVEEEAIPLAPETVEICDALSVDPLRLIGSGSLLLAVEEGKEPEVERALGPLCEVSRIGRLGGRSRTVVGTDGSGRLMREAPQDELWRALSGHSRSSHRL